MSSPSKVIRPPLAGRVPASTARKVDLPAPLGPIRPVISPRGTSSETPSTACMPSNCRRTSRATSIGPSGRVDTFDLRFGTAFEDPPGLGPDAFGSEPQEPEDEQPDQDPLEGGDEVGRPDVEPDQEACHLFEADRHEQRPEDGPEVVAAPAHDDGREKDDGLRVQ